MGSSTTKVACPYWPSDCLGDDHPAYSNYGGVFHTQWMSQEPWYAATWTYAKDDDDPPVKTTPSRH